MRLPVASGGSGTPGGFGSFGSFGGSGNFGGFSGFGGFGGLRRASAVLAVSADSAAQAATGLPADCRNRLPPGCPAVTHAAPSGKGNRILHHKTPASTRRATGNRKFRKRIPGTEIGDNTKQFSGRTKQDPAKRKVLFSFMFGIPHKSGMSCKKRSGKSRSPDNGSTGLPAKHLGLVYQTKPDSTLTAWEVSGLQPEV